MTVWIVTRNGKIDAVFDNPQTIRKRKSKKQQCARYKAKVQR